MSFQMAPKPKEGEGEDGGDDAGAGLRTNLLTAFFALTFLAFFLSIGSCIFTIWENWRVWNFKFIYPELYGIYISCGIAGPFSRPSTSASSP